MSEQRIKRLRIFAGPNGSGKSTLFNYLLDKRFFRSYYHINPDEIAKELPVGLSLESFPIEFSETELRRFLERSTFRLSKGLSSQLMLNGKTLKILAHGNLTYLSAALGEFLRGKMLSSNSSFSFETVLSHPSKVEFIKVTKEAGYKVYLYFISTRDWKINLSRIENRVQLGGHPVPPEKIRARYGRSMENLYEALKCVDRAFLFDNSDASDPQRLIAELGDGNIRLYSEDIPEWFAEYVQAKADR